MLRKIVVGVSYLQSREILILLEITGRISFGKSIVNMLATVLIERLK